MRDFLLISYLYPPVVNAGTQHIIRFVRYLPDMGYHPIILTSATRGELADDAAKDVFRAGEVFSFLKRSYRARQLQQMTDDHYASMTLTPRRGIGSWLRRWTVPDLQVPWYPLALRCGRALAKTYAIQALYSTSGPETNHLVALALKRETNLPWVADFRDGWLFEPLIAARLTVPLRHKIESRLERAVVRTADQITVLNQLMADDLYSRYPEAAHKVTIIGNGFDASDFADIERKPTGKFTLVHTGALALSREGTTMNGLLETLVRLKAENHTLMRDLQIIMVGRLTENEIASIPLAGVMELFTLVQEVPDPEALQYQVNAEALLLITHPTDLAVSTTKLFEYLGARRPIFALTPRDSAAGAIIRETQAGVAAPPDDPNAIYVALVTLYYRWRNSELQPPSNARIARHEYQFLTHQLAAVFNRMIRT